MKLQPTAISGVTLLHPQVRRDKRGFFLESWNERTFERLGINARFVQDNHSHSAAGTLRGLHYQLTRPQGKVVRVVRGAVFDVAVDLRRASPTFGAWVGFELSADNQRLLWVPPGCAHGFLALKTADVVYKCTEFYDADDERTLLWSDDDLAIDWPLEDGSSPLISDSDSRGVSLQDAETYS